MALWVTPRPFQAPSSLTIADMGILCHSFIKTSMASDAPRKTVVITGCSAGGIGDALARSFHSKGHRVFATARDLSRAQHLKEMGMTVLSLDVVDAVSLRAAVKAVGAVTGATLDILVNNSGVGMKTSRRLALRL